MKHELKIKEKSIVSIYIQQNLLGFNGIWKDPVPGKKKDDTYFNASFL